MKNRPGMTLAVILTVTLSYAGLVLYAMHFEREFNELVVGGVLLCFVAAWLLKNVERIEAGPITISADDDDHHHHHDDDDEEDPEGLEEPSEPPMP